MKCRGWVVKVGVMAWAVGMMGCMDACGGGEESAAFEYGEVVQARCELVAQGDAVIALDERGERFVVGRGPVTREARNWEDVPYLMTVDGGETYRPILGEYEDRSGNWEIHDRGNRTPGLTRGWAPDEEHVFLFGGVPGPDYRDTSSDLEWDWLMIWAEGDEAFRYELAEFGSFALVGANGEDWWANRRWEVGEYVVATDTEEVFLSRDGGARFEKVVFGAYRFERVSRVGGQVGTPEAEIPRFEPEPVEEDSYWRFMAGAVEYQAGWPMQAGEYSRMLPLRRIEGEEVWNWIVDFGELPAVQFVAVVGEPDEETLRVVAAQEGATEFMTRNYLCDVGPGVEGSVEKLPPVVAPESLEPGEIGLFARVNSRADLDLDRHPQMKVTAGRRVVLMSDFGLTTDDFEVPVVPFARDSQGFEELDGLDGLIGTTESVATVLYRSGGTKGLTTYDLIQGQKSSEDLIGAYRSVPDVDVSGVESSMGLTLMNRTSNGAVELRLRQGDLPIQEAEIYEGRADFAGRKVAWAVTRGLHEGFQTTYIRVGDMVSGRKVEALECEEDVTLEGCAVFEGARPEVRIDREGRLFALDRLGRKLWRHRADLGPDQWEVVVEGWLYPRTMELLHSQGRVFALVLDGGQVWAVDVDSEGPIQRSL